MKRAIVIGATSGIGKAFAEILAENGYKVGITGRRTALLEEMKSGKPASYFIKTLDVTEAKSIAEKLPELTAEIGGLDLLAISSGTGDLNENLDFNIELGAIETNVIGFTCLADWAFNYFANQKYGHLIGITSVGGLRGNRQAPSYSATKAFQINYLEGLRQKTAFLKLPITITDVRPGFVNTGMAKGEGIFWLAPVHKAAMQIYRAVIKRRKIVYVTKRWRLVATILKRIPGVLFERM
jgi:short-subunit dehydrogenase